MNDVETIKNLIKDEVLNKLNHEGCKTKNDVEDIIGPLKSNFIADVECAFDDLFLEYCEKNNLKWEK